jgi:hypothetical protein
LVNAAIISLDVIGFSAGAGEAPAGFSMVGGAPPPVAGAGVCAHTAPADSKVTTAPAIKVRDLKVISELLFKLKEALLDRSVALQPRLIAYCCFIHIMLASDTFDCAVQQSNYALISPYTEIKRS